MDNIFIKKASLVNLMSHNGDGTVSVKGCSARFNNQRNHVESEFEYNTDLYEEIWELLDRQEFEEQHDYYVRSSQD